MSEDHARRKRTAMDAEVSRHRAERDGAKAAERDHLAGEAAKRGRGTHQLDEAKRKEQADLAARLDSELQQATTRLAAERPGSTCSPPPGATASPRSRPASWTATGPSSTGFEPPTSPPGSMRCARTRAK